MSQCDNENFYCSDTYVNCFLFQIIRELREEVEMLKALLKEKIAEKPTGTKETVEIEEMLSENEKLMKECTMSWEQKEKQTEQIMQVLGTRVLRCLRLGRSGR